MNYTSLEEAYKIHHTNSNTYGGTIQYSTACIFCKNPTSIPLMNDGGSFRRCERCRKNFKATVINDAINNHSYSTSHLKGTN
jgi:hypothetical protein